MPKSRFSQRLRNKLNRGKESEVLQNPPSTSTALLSPKKPSSTSSSSKNIKRRKTRMTLADSKRERSAQKTKREEVAEDQTRRRHKGLNVTYFKHSFFQKSQWSRSFDLNTSHVILFKSPRNLQQFDHLGRQLNAPKFLPQSYDLATRTALDIY